jgi:hypothetical protein
VRGTTRGKISSSNNPWPSWRCWPRPEERVRGETRERIREDREGEEGRGEGRGKG